MSDTEFSRLVKARIDAGTAYVEACEALANYHAGEVTKVKREIAADPAVLARVTGCVNDYLSWRPLSTVNSCQLAAIVNQRYVGMPSAKTLENVYLPALRETSPHVVRSGQQWLWFRNAKLGAASVSRETA